MRHTVAAPPGAPTSASTRYQYSWFYNPYHQWLGKQGLVTRQDIRAGEKLFVDYADHKAAVVNQHTGDISDEQIFIAMPAVFNYTYVEATWTQGLQDWFDSHQRTFIILGGVLEIVVRIICAQASAKHIAMSLLSTPHTMCSPAT